MSKAEIKLKLKGGCRCLFAESWDGTISPSLAAWQIASRHCCLADCLVDHFDKEICCQDEGAEEITDTEYVIIRGEAILNAIRAPSRVSDKLTRYHGHVPLSRH